MVDLSQYLGKNVEVVLRSGDVFTGMILRSRLPYGNHPFMFNDDTYTKTGNLYVDLRMSQYDIISIRIIDDGDSCEEMKQKLQELHLKMERMQKEIESLRSVKKQSLPEDFRRKDCLKLLGNEVSVTALGFAFRWGRTPQGFVYWSDICKGLKEGKPIPEDAKNYIKDMVILSYREELSE
jgi:hypothetical protein